MNTNDLLELATKITFVDKCASCFKQFSMHYDVFRTSGNCIYEYLVVSGKEHSYVRNCTGNSLDAISDEIKAIIIKGQCIDNSAGYTKLTNCATNINSELLSILDSKINSDKLCYHEGDCADGETD